MSGLFSECSTIVNLNQGYKFFRPTFFWYLPPRYCCGRYLRGCYKTGGQTAAREPRVCLTSMQLVEIWL